MQKKATHGGRRTGAGRPAGSRALVRRDHYIGVKLYEDEMAWVCARGEMMAEKTGRPVRPGEVVRDLIAQARKRMDV